MKIRLVNYTSFPFHGYGGAELYIYNYAKSLLKKGHKVEIVCNSYDTHTSKKQHFEGIDFIFLGKPFYGYFEKNKNKAYQRKLRENNKILGFLYRFIFWIELYRYQLNNPSSFVHAFSDTGFIFTFFSKVKLISTIFDIENRGLRRIGLWGITLPIKTFYYSATTSRIIKKSSYVTSGGIDNSRELVEIFGCKKQKIVTLPNAINVNLINKSSQENDSNENNFDDKFQFISIGRLEYLKNPLLTLDVYEKILKENPTKGYRLLLIGDGPLKQQVEKRIEHINLYLNGNVELKSQVTEQEKNIFLKKSDFYINLAETRYMLLVVMEAMACNLAVYSKYPLDGILLNNENGFIFNSNDSSRIAKKINDFISKNDIKKMGRKSNELVKEFTWKRTAKHGIEIYNKLKKHYNLTDE